MKSSFRGSEMNSEDYKNYSLRNLKEWVEDSLNSESTPIEIYSCVINTLQENINFHQKSLNRVSEVLSLFKNTKVISMMDKTKTSKWVLPVQIDKLTGEYYFMLPNEILKELNWYEGDSLEWIPNGDYYSVRKK